jgi:hypothetical protein
MIDVYAPRDLLPAGPDRRIGEELTLAVLSAEGVSSRCVMARKTKETQSSSRARPLAHQAAREQQAYNETVKAK